jgi:hypothetical protein
MMTDSVPPLDLDLAVEPPLQLESAFGIEFSIKPRTFYLEILAALAANQFENDPRSQNLVALCSREIGYRPPVFSTSEREKIDFAAIASEIGWYHPERLEQLIQREWIADETNEFLPQIEVLRQIPALHESRRIEIMGAGVARLAAHLAENGAIEHILCRDLSWFALDLGRSLIAGRLGDIPPSLRRSRRVLHLDARAMASLIEESVALEDGLRDSIGKRSAITWQVADACAGSSIRSDADTVVAPFLYDAAAKFGAMLVRHASSLAIGQRLVIMTSLSAQRNPVHLQNLLKSCGFRIEFAQARRWPYSLSRHDWSYTAEICPVLIVQAERIHHDLASNLCVAPCCGPDTMIHRAAAPLFPGQRLRSLTIGQREIKAWAKAYAARTYFAFAQILAAELGSEAAHHLLAFAIRHGFFDVFDTRQDGRVEAL